MLMSGTAGAEPRGAGGAGEAEQEGEDVLMIAEHDTEHASGSERKAVELTPSVGNAGEAEHEAEATGTTLAQRDAVSVEVAEVVQATPAAADADEAAQAGLIVEVSAEHAERADEAIQDISQDARQHDNETSAAHAAALHAESREGYQEQVYTVSEVMEATIEVPVEASASGRPDVTAGAVEDEAAQRDGAGAVMVAAEAEIEAEAAAADCVVAALSAAEADSSDGGADGHEQCEVAELDNLAKQAGGEGSAGAEGKLPAPLWEQFYGAVSDAYLWQGAAQHSPEIRYIGWESRRLQSRKACYRQAACTEGRQTTAFSCAFWSSTAGAEMAMLSTLHVLCADACHWMAGDAGEGGAEAHGYHVEEPDQDQGSPESPEDTPPQTRAGARQAKPTKRSPASAKKLKPYTPAKLVSKP